MMSLGTILLGATVTLMLTSVCSAGICDLGPPGQFCMSSLVGYHDCVYNRNTSRVEDRIVRCPAGTRCSCMGVACKTNNPCQRFVLPPIMPDSYRADYNEKKTLCSPRGCNPTYIHVSLFRDAVRRRYKAVRTISNQNPTYEYFIVLPLYHWGRRYSKYHIVPGTRSCTKSFISRFPSKIEIPSRFKYSGRRYVFGEYTKKWMWVSGGRHSGQGLYTQTWDSAQTIDRTPNVVQYIANYQGSQMSKSSLNINRYYYSFKPGAPSGIEFQLPTYCRR